MAKIWKYTGLLLIVMLAVGTALVATGHSVKADAPSDNITSPMSQAGSEPVEQQTTCDNTNDGGVLRTAANYIQIEVDCWHSGYCWACDEYADYGCYPDVYCWIPTCPFVDPLPADHIVSRIDAEVRGAPCSGTPLINVFVNDRLVGEGHMTGDCACGNCYPLSVSGYTYPDGFPGYVYGGENILRLDISDDTCISNVYLTLYYGTPTASTPKVSPAISRPFNPSQMSVQYLSVNPNQTASAQPVTITTNVVNTGDQAGNLNVALKINGQVEETRMVSVGPMATQPVKFTVSRSEPGTYAVDILGQEGSFTVIDSGAGTHEPVNGTLVVILAMGVLAVIVAVLIIRSYNRKTN